jgi:translocator protein
MSRTALDWGGNIVAFLLTIVVNFMATSIPLGGQTPREISENYPSLFTPSSLTFSIWGLIYLSLTLFVIYQALPAQRSKVTLATISPLFKLNCLANAAWILAWHYDFLILSVLIMVSILASLVAIYRVLDAERASATALERAIVHFPFRLYLGWICVALIANVSTVQTAMGWDNVGIDSVNWTLLKLALAGAIAATIMARKADVVTALVVSWAGYGIYIKQAATPQVSGAAISLAVLLLMLAVFELFRPSRTGRGVS